MTKSVYVHRVKVMNKLFENIKYNLHKNSIKTEEALGRLLKEKSLTVSTAESCTGGLVASRITDISGSSEYFKEAYVTYANEIKHKNLGVSNETLEKYGAVSSECAFEMAQGLSKRTGCDVAICTTGIAGPTGGSKNKPVGLIYIAVKYHDKIVIREFKLNPALNRRIMKYNFSELALKTAIELLDE